MISSFVTYIFSRSCSTCINFLEEGVGKLIEGIEVLFRIELREEVCDRRHIASSRRAARIAGGGPSFCWGDSAGPGAPATVRAAASLRSDAFSLSKRSFKAFKLSSSLINFSFLSSRFWMRSSISSILAFFRSREVCAATRFFSFLNDKHYSLFYQYLNNCSVEKVPRRGIADIILSTPPL